METNKNLPAKAETKELSVGAKMAAEQEDEFSQVMLEAIVEKFSPQIKHLKNKIDDYLGDGEKLFIMRRKSLKHKSEVIVVDLSHELHIHFTPDDLIRIFKCIPIKNEDGTDRTTVDDFLHKILTGGFSK